jgi:hypothetical protein
LITLAADQEGALEGSEELPAIPPTQKSKFLRFRVYYSGKQASFDTKSFGHEISRLVGCLGLKSIARIPSPNLAPNPSVDGSDILAK